MIYSANLLVPQAASRNVSPGSYSQSPTASHAQSQPTLNAHAQHPNINKTLKRYEVRHVKCHHTSHKVTTHTSYMKSVPQSRTLILCKVATKRHSAVIVGVRYTQGMYQWGPSTSNTGFLLP